MEFRFCPRCASELAQRPIADDAGLIDRLACPAESCGYVHWGNPTPAVGALVEHEGEIILARGQGWPDGWFALVTGYLEAREDPKAGVAREVKEELDQPADRRPWRRATGLAVADWMRSRNLAIVWDERPALTAVPAQPVKT